MSDNKVIMGDCYDVIPSLENKSVDLVKKVMKVFADYAVEIEESKNGKS